LFAAARSTLTNAEAVIRQSQAALRHAEIELERTAICSPVDGVVIGRDAEFGQTVAAALQAPIIFTIAQDLRDMQVNASVDESEIGRIEPGQRVEFTVDAYRDRRLEGSVEQIRKSPSTAQNVVTYTVILKAANSDLLLLPGMTASVRFVIAEARDIAIAPNAALRISPEGAAPVSGPHVWVGEAGEFRPIPVEIGLTDEARTEIRGDGIALGLRVVTGIERAQPQLLLLDTLVEKSNDRLLDVAAHGLEQAAAAGRSADCQGEAMADLAGEGPRHENAARFGAGKQGIGEGEPEAQGYETTGDAHRMGFNHHPRTDAGLQERVFKLDPKGPLAAEKDERLGDQILRRNRFARRQPVAPWKHDIGADTCQMKPFDRRMRGRFLHQTDVDAARGHGV
jgi:hypothetical protein